MKDETQYMQNAQGHFVPLSLVKDIDVARNDLVLEIIGHAQELNASLNQFKGRVFGDIEAFIDLSAEKYDTHIGGKKGNITLVSYDGRYKVQRAISESITFDERLQVAKQLVDECIHSWSEGANDNIKALVEHAFQTDKEGKINVSRIFGLMKLDIREPKWKKAMAAISDSIQIAGSKTYIRVYERDPEDANKWNPIPLDLAKA